VKLGPDNATILDLVENLHHSKPFVREQIALALGKSRLFPEQGIPALIRQLKDRNPDVRHAALSALGEYGPAARSAIPALMEAMEVHRGYWHDSPAETLAQIGSDSVPQLLDALKSGREYPAFGPFDALRKLGLQAASAVPELAELLTASNEGMRFKAEILLTEIGPEARLAVPALEKLRTIKERQSRIDRVLIAIGSPAVDTFLRDLDPNKLERSLIAIKALGEMRVRAEKSLPVLNDLARSENRRLRFAAAEAISKIGTRREAAILVAHEMLTDRSPTIRVTGAEILGKFGPQELSDATVNALLLSTKDGDPGVRLAAAQGLSKLGGPARRQALPVLAALVADSRPEFQQIRETAVNLIVAMLDHKER
jgi:HEAT repeat protein